MLASLLTSGIETHTPPRGCSSKLNFTSLCFSTTLRILIASLVTFTRVSG